MKYLLTVLIAVLSFNRASADTVGYSDSLIITVASEHLIVRHYHNWGRSTRDSRYKMISTDANPFTAANDYAYIECVEKKIGKLLFRKPCSALRKLIISADEKYIVGISNIKLWNPYQLLVYTAQGDLLKRRRIRTIEARLSQPALDSFERRYHRHFAYFKLAGQIYAKDSISYIDCSYPKTVDTSLAAFGYLLRYRAANHLSSNFSESVTNYIFWYADEDPKVEFHYYANKLDAVSLLDPARKRFTIKILE